MTPIEVSDRKRLERSALVSAAIWAVFALAFVLVPVRQAAKKVPDFETVHITLNAAPAPKASAAAVEETDTAAAKAALTPAPLSASKPAIKASKSAPQPSAKPSVKPSSKSSSALSKAAPSKAAPAGLGIPNFSTPVTESREPTGDAEYLDFSSSRQTASPVAQSAPKGGTSRSEFEGVAASVDAAPSGAKTTGSSVSGKPSSAAPSAASSETQAVLGEITASASGSAAGISSGTASGVSGGTASAAGSKGTPSETGTVSSVTGLDFDGTPRRLLYPANPSITLPDNLARLVDSNRSVTVSFTVRADGTVPVGLVSFTPSAILPAEIRDYLRKEFSGWRFEKSGTDGQARFLYSIKVE